MAHETVTKSKRFYCVSLKPDICKTPIGNTVQPIPYTIIGEFAEAQAVSPNVKSHSEPVILHGKSFIPTVKGDASGTVGGTKSATFGQRVETKQYSSTKGSNGTQTVQESRFVWMNNGNTIGRMYERATQIARARLKQLSRKAKELADEVDKKTEEARKSLKPAAEYYKKNISADMHQFGNNMVDMGTKTAKVSTGLAVVGGGMIATGIAAPEGVIAEQLSMDGFAIAATETTIGTGADSLATSLDQAADYITSGKRPDVLGTLGTMAGNAAQNVIFKKFGLDGAVKWLKSKFTPGKKQPRTSKPKPEEKPPRKNDGRDGGKSRKEEKPKSDKPSTCCPQNAGPGGKPVQLPHPVHIGTGEEILSQTDFALDGPIPVVWTRTYRSGSETEDWGLLGARWATPYTTSLSLCRRGIVYHDGSGRAVRLPAIPVGSEHDCRAEGFILRRNDDTRFTLVWRDGSTNHFEKGPDGWLPHGYQGVNAMLAPQAPAPAERFYLARSQGSDGRGMAIERCHAAQPGEVVLRLITDDGLVVEAFRDDDPATDVPRIGRIEEVRGDERTCHAVYRYAPEPVSAPDTIGEAVGTPAQQAFAALPARVNLVAQTNLTGQVRTYTYEHHLLVRYTTYGGFAHGLEWVSLAALRERWAGSPLNDSRLAERHPITLDNSYQARAIRTTTADGHDEYRLAYLDADTTRVTEPGGGLLEYTFDANWLATNVRRITPGKPPRSLGKREWDKDGMLLAEIDAEGNATRYTYDAAGNLTAITDARYRTTRIEYDAGNRPIAITDPLGHVTRHRYGDAGRITESTDALDRTTRYRYDGQGRLVVLIDARDGEKRLAYDAAGRLTAYTDCSGYTQRYVWDRAGRLTEGVDAEGHTSHYQYDVQGRLVAVTRADQTTEHFEYDAEGNLVAHTDARGQVTRYRYNGHGLPIERLDAKGQTLQYRYDPALRLSELINGNGESYRFAYDAEGRLISETGFDGKVTRYEYDAAGRLIASECNGKRTDYMRDALGLLLAASTGDSSVRYAYDALGRLTAVASPEAEQRFFYDPVGQLVEERHAYRLAPSGALERTTAPTAAFTLQYAYDALGNRIQTILPNGRRIDTLRYGSGHWHGTLWQSRSLVDLERDRLHRETVRQIGTARERLVATRAYDPQSRLSAMTLRQGQQHLRERRYQYDATGNLTSIEDSRRGSIQYSYDPLGQLLSAVQPDLTETFAFDPAGNLLDTAAQDKPAATDLRALTEQPSAGSTPKLAKVTHNLLRQYLGYAYDYDSDGNTVVKHLRPREAANDNGQLALAYDVHNRLITATRTFEQTEQIAHYQYDAFGRRIAKHVTDTRANRTHTTVFVWDGDVLAQEISDDQTVTYLYEPGSFVPLARIASREGLACHAAEDMHLPQVAEWELPQDKDDPAAHLDTWRVHREQEREAQYRQQWQARLERASEEAVDDRIHYYHCDHLGTPLELTDDQGKAVWSARYRAWGRILRYDVKDVAQPLRFQGQYEDEETGLYYNRYRYYDPDTARFLTQDPIGFAGGYNFYAYAPNPIGWTDPNGLKRTPHSGKCMDDAARSALNSANPKSIRLNKEYGGLIYEKGGQYFATIPVAGTGHTFKPIFAFPQVPSGATIVGDYHTHGDYSIKGKDSSVVRTSDPMQDSFNSDTFSDEDRRIHMLASLRNKCHRSYLGTPSGKYKVLIGGTEHDF